MADQTEELAAVIRSAPVTGGADVDLSRPLATHLLEAGYRKPRTITTAEELDALKFQAVVLDVYGNPYVCERHRTDGTRNEWKPAGMDHLDDSEDVLYHGPVTVAHEGDGA